MSDIDPVPTKDQVLALIAAACALCHENKPVRFRPETREFVHDGTKGHFFSQTYCTATNLRNEHQSILNG